MCPTQNTSEQTGAESGPWELFSDASRDNPTQIEHGPWENYANADDRAPLRSYVQKNLDALNRPAGGDPSAPKPAVDFLDAFVAGLQVTSGGLAIRNKMPDTILPEHASLAMKTAMTLGQVAGDAPAALVGGMIGEGAGPPGLMAGAYALPAGLRAQYVQDIQQGKVRSFEDFWARTASTAWEMVKGATTGIATSASGGISAEKLAEAGLSPMIQGGGKLAAELAAMTTIGKGLEGQVPKPEDFALGAIALAGLHGTVKLAAEMPDYARNIQSKLQDTYAETGLQPHEIITEAAQNPVLRQELLSSDRAVPNSLEPVRQPVPPEFAPKLSKMVDAKVPAELQTPAAGLDPEFSPIEMPRVQAPEPPETPSATPSDLSDSKAAILSRVGEVTKDKGWSWNKFYTGALDQFNPIRQLRDALTGDEPLPANEDPYMLASKMRAAGTGAAEVFIDHGPIGFESREATGTPSLKAILEPFKGDFDGFRAYAIAARAVELEGRGIETGVPIEQAKSYVEANRDKYGEGFQKLVNFQNDTLAYLRDSGVISEEGYKTIVDKNRAYLPFTRISEGEAGGKGRGGLNPIKSITGSDAKIVDPIESVIRNTFAYVKTAEQNRARLALVDLAAKSDSGLITEVTPPTKAVAATDAELAAYFRANGIEASDPETLTLFRKQASPLGKDEIAVMRDGKRYAYNVGEDAAKALNATDYQAPNLMLKAISIPAKMIRTGAVETIDFLSRHFVRDQTNAFVLSDNGYVPVIDALKGLKSYFKEDETYQRWLSSGGGMSSLVSLDRDYIQPKIFELSKETGLIDKATNVLKNPLQVMQAMAEAITSAPRLGEFARAEEAGKSIDEAAYAARNVTIDNQRIGADNSVRAMSLINAFWNTRIQGIDRMVRAFTDDPVRTATRASLAITLPSVLLWWENHDDPRYQELPRWQKDLFWIVMTQDHVFRIPKPFEMGILFGSAPERILDALFEKNPDAFKGFGSALLGGAVPNPIPTAFMPAIEQFANRSWLTGGNLVPHSLEGVAPAYQYSSYTSETAKALGKMIGYVPGVRDIGPGNVTLASPMVIENYVRAWTGGMGTYALQLADKALQATGIASPPPKAEATLADMPIIKSFVVRYPSAQAQSIQDFYDNFQKSQTTFATMRDLAKTGQAKELQRYTEMQSAMPRLSGIEQALSNQNRMIQVINRNPEMSPSDKRQLIDKVYLTMIQVARAGNEAMRGLRE